MENDESCIYLHELSTVLSPEPALKTAPVVLKGRIQCSICFIGTLQRNTKRAGIQKIRYYRFSRKSIRVEKIQS